MNWWVVVRRVQTGVSICLRRRAFAPWEREQVSTEWSRCPGYTAWVLETVWLHCDEVQQVWMPARMGRLSAGAGRRHPVKIRKASLMAGSMRRVWALRHQTGAQYSVIECTRAKVAVRNIVAPALQPEPASRLKSVTRNVSFLRSDARCRLYVGELCNATPRHGRPQNFFQGGAKSTFCLSFSGWWRCNANGGIEKRKCSMLRQQLPTCKKTLQWAFLCLSEHGFFKTELAEFEMNYKFCEFLEYVYNLIKIRTNNTFTSNSFSLFSCFSNALEFCKCARWDFTTQMVWR